MAGEQYEIYESGTAAALAEAQLALLDSKADKTGTYSTLTAGGTTPNSVTDAMLAQTGGVLSRLNDFMEYVGYEADYVDLCTTSGAIQASDGAPYTSYATITDNYKYSDFIAVKDGDTISYKLRAPSNYCMIAFYTTDETNGYVASSSVVGTGAAVSGTFTAPSDGYVRITARNDLADKQAIYAVNGELQTQGAQINQNTADIERIKEGRIVAVDYGVVENEYVNQFNGTFTAYAGWNRTVYVPTPSTAKLNVYSVTKASIYNYFYKADKSPLSRFDLVVGNNEIAIPSGAAYYILSTSAADLATIKIIDPASYADAKAIAELQEEVLPFPQYVKFATWNVGLFNNGITPPSTADSPQQMIEFRKIVGSIDADLLDAQEFRQYFDASDTIDATTNVTDFKYPFDTKTTQNSGVLSFAKCPMSDVTKTTFTSGSGKYYISYDVEVCGKTVTVVNAHLSIEQDPTTHRTAEIAELITFMDSKDYVILSGDFNAASQSEYDAFVTAGYTICNGGSFGWFSTWPITANLPDGWQTTWPCENLDNIIVSSNIVPQDISTVECGISDHAPLVAMLRID